MKKSKNNSISEDYLLSVGWVEDISDNMSYEDTQIKTNYFKLDKYHIRIREGKFYLIYKFPIDSLKAPFIIRELKFIDRFESLFYELTDVKLKEIEDVLEIFEMSNINIPNDYEREDYRETVLNSLNRFAVGTGGHDYVLISKRNKTFMTFLKESLFGEKIIEKYIIDNNIRKNNVCKFPYKERIHSHPMYEKQLNLPEDKIIVDIVYSHLFNTVENIPDDNGHVIADRHRYNIIIETDLSYEK